MTLVKGRNGLVIEVPSTDEDRQSRRRAAVEFFAPVVAIVGCLVGFAALGLLLIAIVKGGLL